MGTALIYVCSTVIEEKGQWQSHQKLFQALRCISNRTFHQACSTVTSDHKIRRQRILQDSKIRLLRRLSYAWFLQAKGSIPVAVMFEMGLLCLQNEGHTQAVAGPVEHFFWNFRWSHMSIAFKVEKLEISSLVLLHREFPCSLQTFTMYLSEVNFKYTLLCKMLMRQSRNWAGLLKQVYQITVTFCSFTGSTCTSHLKCCSSLIACSLEKSPSTSLVALCL